MSDAPPAGDLGLPDVQRLVSDRVVVNRQRLHSQKAEIVSQEEGGRILLSREQNGGQYGAGFDLKGVAGELDRTSMQYSPSLVVADSPIPGGSMFACLPLSPLSPVLSPVLGVSTARGSTHNKCSLGGGEKLTITAESTKQEEGSAVPQMKLGMALLGGDWANGWVFVGGVKPDLAAAQAGIIKGDAILAINGRKPQWATASQQLVRGREQGLELSILRNAQVIMHKEGEHDDKRVIMSAIEFCEQSSEGKMNALFKKKTARGPPASPASPAPAPPASRPRRWSLIR
jgi:hypothetical protein